MDEQIRNSSVPLQLKAGVDYHPAPMLIRSLAYVMDLTASVLITLALYRFAGLFLRSAFSGNPFLASTFSQSMFFIGGFGYWVVVPMATGATPAKMLFRMRIVPEANSQISPTQIILREVIGQILTLLTLGIGFLIALRDENRKGLNDRLARTRLVQFTSPHPELYRVQDLCTVDNAGTLQSRKAGEFQITEAFDSATVEPIEEIPPPIEEVLLPADSPEGRSLYVRQSDVTAYERKMRAAMGPTVQELSSALRRTAEMVDEGKLTQKVLDRKREDFVLKIRTADLGEPPDDSVREIVELGKSGLLTRKELAEVLEILRERLNPQASAD